MYLAIIIILGSILYFLPAINGYSKKKNNAGAILALNILLGWTFIGWVVAFVWSCTKDVKEVVSEGEKPERKSFRLTR